MIGGDVVLRGTGDPSLQRRSGRDGGALARRGVRTIEGAVMADPRRIGADERCVTPMAARRVDARGHAARQAVAARPPVVNHGSC